MNKGKENYQNIPLPDGLSDAVQKGLKKGKRHMEKKWIAAIGTLAAACVLGFVVLRVLPVSLRAPQGATPPLSRVWRLLTGRHQAAAFTARKPQPGIPRKQTLLPLPRKIPPLPWKTPLLPPSAYTARNADRKRTDSAGK